MQTLSEKTFRELMNKGLLSTKPLHMTGVSSKTGIAGYVLHVYSDITVSSIKCALDPNSDDIAAATVLPVGYYYLAVSELSIAAGACFIYQHEYNQA